MDNRKWHLTGKVMHLTLTTQNTGVVLCGAAYKLPTAEYMHATYAPLDHPEVCPACLAEWNAPDDQTEGA